MVIAALRRALTQRLAEGGLESASFESAELLCHVLGVDRATLTLLPPHTVPTRRQTEELEQLTTRRLAGEPLQYLLGEWSFYGRPFLTRPGVLIPRPETEQLIDVALEYLRALDASDTHVPDVLDLCCGTGCIGLTLALEWNCRVTLLDLAPQALALAGENRDRLDAPCCTLIGGDALQAPPSPLLDLRVDLLVCNPPYLRSEELNYLQREVTFEPPLALDGGPDGLCFYRAVTAHWLPLLRPGGMLLVEHGLGQGTSVAQLMEEADLRRVETRLDYAGADRLSSGIVPFL